MPAGWTATVPIVLWLVGLSYLYLPVWHGDAAIYLPYVRALVEEGRWMNFNPGELSSGATSPLWVVWVAPWWAIVGVHGLKIAGGIATIVAVVAAFIWAQHRGARPEEALLPALAVAYCVAPAGFLGYETPLAALGGMAWTYVFPPGSHPEGGRKWLLALLSAVTPLIRPEMGLLVVAAGAVLLLQRRWRAFFCLLAGAAVPIAYYGAMQVLTGNFSASSYCRSFALREMAEFRIGAFVHLSGSFLLEFIRSGFVLIAAAASGALLRSWRRWDAEQWFSGLAVLLYLLFFVVVAPLNSARYMAPIAPLLASLALREMQRWGMHRRSMQIVPTIVIVLLVANVLLKAWDDRRRGYDFAVVTERPCAEFLNALAEPGAWVLAYEVQIRFWLRPDLRVLSLDGVTDGKIAPYLKTADVTSFLWRWRPRYWVANEAVWRRPFLRQSLLAEVLQRTEPVVVVGGIRFERLGQWAAERLPRGFYGCTAVYRLHYGAETLP